jgi:hypothetical protein
VQSPISRGITTSVFSRPPDFRIWTQDLRKKNARQAASHRWRAGVGADERCNGGVLRRPRAKRFFVGAHYPAPGGRKREMFLGHHGVNVIGPLTVRRIDD